METIMEKIEDEVYMEDEPFYRIGFRDDNNGTTSYYSSNITKAEAEKIDAWCQEIGISPLNTRLFKTKPNVYELRIASQFADPAKTPYLKTFEKDGIKL